MKTAARLAVAAAAAVALTFTVAIVAAQAAPPKKKAAAAKPEAVTLNAAELKWGDAPPAFPKGAHLAVLHGDPSKKGEYALRFKMPGGYKIAPHWHTQDEQLTVLSGTFVLHMGDTMDAPAHKLAGG